MATPVVPASWIQVQSPRSFARRYSQNHLAADLTPVNYSSAAAIIFITVPEGREGGTCPWEWSEAVSTIRKNRSYRGMRWPNLTAIYLLSRLQPLEVYPIGYMWADCPTHREKHYSPVAELSPITLR